MEKSVWLTPFTEYAAPDWACPRCAEGRLALESESLRYRASADSQDGRKTSTWGSRSIRYRFVAWLCCSRSDCQESVCVAGEGRVESERPGSKALIAHFRPLFVHPMPDMFPVAQGWPDAVTRPLRRAFGSFFPDPIASANHLRSAVEHLLDELGVERESEKRRLSLHRRLQLLEARDARLARRLMGVKELGNAASHGVEILRGLILDAMALLENTLVEVFEGGKLDETANRLRETYRLPKND